MSITCTSFTHFNSTKVQFGGPPEYLEQALKQNFNSTKVQFGGKNDKLNESQNRHFNSTKVQFGGVHRDTDGAENLISIPLRYNLEVRTIRGNKRI